MTESTLSSSVNLKQDNLGLSENPDLIPQKILGNDSIQAQIKNTSIEDSDFCNKENQDITADNIANLLTKDKQVENTSIKSALTESLGCTLNLQENQQYLQTDSEQQEQQLRKQSQADSEMNCEEILEEDVDIRRQINQKLIRNKNYFKLLMRDTNTTSSLNQAYQIKNTNEPNGNITNGGGVLDKRSRSETPDKMSATDVLYRAHQKLQSRRKDSPHKVMEKHQQRQKKAEELRSQIEKSKKEWYEKIRVRQQIAKERWQELLAGRKAKLYDKLEQAEERREQEIMSLRNKAMQENQKIEETNYIVKMTMNNMKLDLNHKMSETQERRTHHLELQIRKKQQDRTLKEEAAEKKRQELMKENEDKFLRYKQKREQAQMRRTQMLEEKRKQAQLSQVTRFQVLQRKNDLGYKISDVMSFVSNSENIWEFLANERDWQELGLSMSTSKDEELILQLIQQDQFEIEKLKLKRDADLLNKMIIVDGEGNIYSKKEYLSLVKRKNSKHVDYFDDCSSDDDDYYDDIDENNTLLVTPEKRKRQHHASPFINHEEIKEDGIQVTEGSDKESIPEESVNKENDSISNAILSENQDNADDEANNYALYSLRLKMSMKRNILKKNLSEDLTWADFLKNEIYQNHAPGYPSFKPPQTRSMQSTPERKQEIPNESENDLHVKLQNSETKSVKKQNSEVKATLTNHNKKNKSTKSNLSDKSRISSVVYPSQKKKNPKNQVNSNHTQNHLQTEGKGSGSSNSFKKNSGGSNQSSTQSLLFSNSFIETAGNVVPSNRKSIQIECESAKQRQNARMHSSSVQEPSSSYNIQNMNSLINNQQLGEDNSQNLDRHHNYDTQSSTSMTHTGTQMNQLITNSRPMMLPSNKIIPKKLSANANKILFPIREQKLLMKRPGKEGQFGKCKINVRMEDLLALKAQQHQNQSLNQSVIVSSEPLMPDEKKTVESQVDSSSQSSKKNLLTSPNNNKRQDTGQTHSIQTQTSLGQTSQSDLTGTPTQQTSRMLQIQQKFWEKYTSMHQSGEDIAQSGSKKNQVQTASALVQTSLPSESSMSPPKKEPKSLQAKSSTSELEIPSQDTSIILTKTAPESPIMNEQGYKELIIKYLLTDNIHYIKTDDNQKTIAIEGPEADRLINYIEQHEFTIRFCRLCDLIIPDHISCDGHTQQKAHKKSREELGIKEVEDLQFSILIIHSQPGEIEKELIREKEKALKRKVKRIKASMITSSVSHEAASYNPGKEYNSPNKKRFQILCIDLEKQVIPVINNYEVLECTLKEIIKLLDMRKQADLHLMRKLKYIPILIEICKRISVCHKNEFKNLGKILDSVIKVINIFCGLRENRNYMLQTNRMQALIELFNWCLNRPTQLFYGINFMPTLIHILTLHVKHRAPFECQQMKELFIEYLVCSSITTKIKSKFQIINGPLDLSEMMGQVPLFLLKSATFIEAITSLVSMDSVVRPVYEKSSKIGEHILFVIQNNEMFGIIPMITTILLSRNQPFKPSQPNQAILSSCGNSLMPQTLVCLAITSIKILNNIMRMDYKYAQQLMGEFEIQEQLYHLFNYIIFYTVETCDQSEDSKELLHQTLLLIGYFTLNNEKHQQMLCKGENTLLQKLCNLPFTYFCDKKLKEILFPTLIQASYKNDRCLAIMDQELSIEMLVDYIQLNLKEELPKIVEEMDDIHSLSSLGGAQHHHHAAAVDRRTRSPSQSSTSSQCSTIQVDTINGNSPFIPLYMRFPKKHWKDSIVFYSKVLF